MLVIRDNYNFIVDVDEIFDDDLNIIKGFIKEIYNKEIEDIDDDIVIDFLKSSIDNDIVYIYDKNNVVEIDIKDVLKHYLLNIIDNYFLFDLYNDININNDYYFINYNNFDEEIEDLIYEEYKIKDLKQIILNLNDDFFEKINKKDDLFDNFYYISNNKTNIISYDEIIKEIKDNIDDLIDLIINEDNIDIIKDYI